MDYQISLIAIAAAAAAEISQVLYSSLHSLHYFTSFQVILAHLQVDFQAYFSEFLLGAVRFCVYTSSQSNR